MKKLVVLFILILFILTLIILATGCEEYEQPLLDANEEVSTAQTSPPAQNPSDTEYEYPADETETQTPPDIVVSDDPDDIYEATESPDVGGNPNVGERPMIALTFDDGPSIHTERILDVLEEYNARATFFVVGNRVESRQDIVIRAFNMGSEIAGHSWSHRNFSRLSEETILEDLAMTNAIIEYVLGTTVPFFRPPYGIVNGRVVDSAYAFGYSIVNWTADTLDWRYRDADIVYNTVMNLARDGAIILLHDIHETTADAMERAIPSLIARGYRLVTVSEMLYHLYGELEPGRIYGRPGKVD